MRVLVSRKEIEKLLGVPKIPPGSCLEITNSIMELFADWHGVNAFFTGLCFDTTSVNTGDSLQCYHSFQSTFNKHMFFKACRYHILEIIAFFVFDIFFTPSGH